MRAQDPTRLFKKWFREAEAAGTPLPEAMSLATATKVGAPSVRMVLYRGFSRGGFVFYTNYRSRKAAELAANPRAAIAFHWPLLERQVRAEGRIQKLTRQESDTYFASRPRESRLGAWSSPQSEEIPSREFLEREYAETAERYAGLRIPRPPFWGGFRLIPQEIEFWEGRPFRLHDRLSFRRRGAKWHVVRLAP